MQPKKEENEEEVTKEKGRKKKKTKMRNHRLRENKWPFFWLQLQFVISCKMCTVWSAGSLLLVVRKNIESFSHSVFFFLLLLLPFLLLSFAFLFSVCSVPCVRSLQLLAFLAFIIQSNSNLLPRTVTLISLLYGNCLEDGRIHIQNQRQTRIEMAGEEERSSIK